MKIIQSLSLYPDTGGGLEIIVNELTKELQNIGIDTLLVTQGNKTKFYNNKTIPKFYIKSIGDKHLFIPVFSIKNLIRLFTKLNKFSPHLVHIHNILALDYVILIWAIIHDVPIISTIHTIPSKAHSFVDFSPSLEKLFKLKFLDKYFKIIFNNSTGIIALNNVITNELKNLNINTTIFSINNGRNIKKFLPRSSVKNVQSKTINLLSLGHISKRKNQLFLVETMRFLPKEYVLTLAGEVLSEAYIHKIKSKINKYNLKNVKIVGQISQEEVIRTLHNTHIFLSSSKAEVQSLVIIEALSSGTPIVSLKNETTNELVNNSVGKLLSKNTTPKQFASEVTKIINDKNKYNQMCEETIKKVNKFDWEVVVNKTSDAYKKIIEETKNKKLKLSYFQKIQKYIKNFLLLTTLSIVWLLTTTITIVFKIKN